jgi:hypothetical protein
VRKKNRQATNLAGTTWAAASGELALLGVSINQARLECKSLDELQRLHAQTMRLGHGDIAAQLEQLIARKESAVCEACGCLRVDPTEAYRAGFGDAWSILRRGAKHGDTD